MMLAENLNDICLKIFRAEEKDSLIMSQHFDWVVFSLFMGHRIQYTIQEKHYMQA